MGKWVPDRDAAVSARVSRLLADQKAVAERKAAREEREAADRARRANPHSRADQKVRRGGRA